LDDFRPEVPASIWGKIEQDLAYKRSHEISGAKNNRPLRWAVAAAAVVLVALGTWLNIDSSDQVLYLKGPNEPFRIASQESSEAAGFEPFSDVSIRNSSGSADISTLPEDGEKPLTGDKKLSNDLGTISRVLASTLAKTERKTVEQAERIQANEQQEQRMEERAREMLLTQSHTIEARDIQEAAHTTSLQMETLHVMELPTHTVNRLDAEALSIKEAEDTDSRRQKAPAADQGFGVSRLLNMVVAQVDRRPEKFMSFSHDEEGSIKIDLNLAQNRN